MLAQREYGLSGPTAVKDMSTDGTGLSPAAASFLAANCSPFTNPRDMPLPPKVPDPRNTQQTDTMFIWEHFDIPVVNVNGEGEQIILSSADPLAPVPIVWARGVGDNASTYMSPNGLAATYELSGLANMVYKMRALAGRSKKYRVVGHGLKAWVSRNTNVSRGSIEAGQFDCAQTRNTNRVNTAAGTTGRNNLGTYEHWTNGSSTNPQTGLQMLATCSGNIARLRSSIEGAKAQEMGFLAADEGATVRWTDDNSFEFQQTRDRGLVHLHGMGWPVPTPLTYLSYQPILTDASSTQGYVLTDAAFAGAPPPYTGYSSIPIFQPVYNEGQLTTATLNIGVTNGLNKLGSLVTRSNTFSPAGDTPGWLIRPTAVASADLNQKYYTLDGVDVATEITNYAQQPDQQFNTGLYIDCTGLDTTQVITVQVCWHIEYEPKGMEAWGADNSPVDMNFDELAAIARNRLAFPVVTKGHSFFSSLRGAFSRAIGAFGKIFSFAGPAAATVLSAIPDPRAQAVAAGLGAISVLTAKRQKLEPITMDYSVD